MKSEVDNTAKANNKNINSLFEKLLDKSDKQDSKLDTQDKTLESINSHILNHNDKI